MKIALCIGKLSFSGAENVALFLLKHFIDSGYNTHVILLDQNNHGSNSTPGLQVHICPKTSGNALTRPLKRIHTLRTILEEIQPDVVIGFGWASAMNIIPAAKRIKGIKTVFAERNDPVAYPEGITRRLKRDYTYRIADAGVFQTQNISDYFKHMVKNRYVIPNPIREQGKLCKPTAERKKIFVTVARLDDKQKNQTMMIQGFLEACTKHPEFELHLLGDGPDREKYVKLISQLKAENNIKLLGYNSAPTEYIRNCYAFLLTSEFEGMPNALAEAMSVGLPCISTDCGGGGAAALIRNGENGILIPRGSQRQLTQEILRLMERQDICDALGASAYKINCELDGSVIIDQWIFMLQEVITKK